MLRYYFAALLCTCTAMAYSQIFPLENKGGNSILPIVEEGRTHAAAINYRIFDIGDFDGRNAIFNYRYRIPIEVSNDNPLTWQIGIRAEEYSSVSRPSFEWYAKPTRFDTMVSNNTLDTFLIGRDFIHFVDSTTGFDDGRNAWQITIPTAAEFRVGKVNTQVAIGVTFTEFENQPLRIGVRGSLLALRSGVELYLDYSLRTINPAFQQTLESGQHGLPVRLSPSGSPGGVYALSGTQEHYYRIREWDVFVLQLGYSIDWTENITTKPYIGHNTSFFAETYFGITQQIGDWQITPQLSYYLPEYGRGAALIQYTYSSKLKLHASIHHAKTQYDVSFYGIGVGAQLTL